MANDDTLTPAQEILLSQYTDGECGVINRKRAQRLLQSSIAARDFVDGIAAIQRDAAAFGKAFPSPSPEMWSRIERRIEQEERFLALDAEAATAHWHWFERFLHMFGRVSWGAAGGFAAAALMLIIGNLPPSAQNHAGHSPSNPKVQPVQLASGQYSGPAAGNEPARRRYDYLRSEGRVKVIRKPSQRSTIFWIRKREPAAVAPDKNSGGVFFLDPRFATDPVLQGD